MPSIGDRLWEMGKSPSQHMALLTLGLASILVAALLGPAVRVAGCRGRRHTAAPSSFMLVRLWRVYRTSPAATDRIGGRSSAISLQERPSSRLPYSFPPFVPRGSPPG